ncbi:hypothetical protein [Rhodocytophaga aerolata]|nr:hypothetical protein [Rhodocytophaga aerolata]
MCRYIAVQSPRSFMQLMYHNGFLPYDAKKEPVQTYLVKNAISLVKEEGDAGIVKILSVHPDKDLILEVFSKSVDLSRSNDTDRKRSDMPVAVTDQTSVLGAAAESNFTGSEKFAQPATGQNVAQAYPMPIAEAAAGQGAALALIVLILLIIIAIW